MSPEFEAQREYFGDWIADFAIIPQDDFTAESVGICGHYALYTHYTGTEWVSIILPEDVEAGQTILLMKDGLGMENFLTYDTIIQACNMDIDENGKTDTFNCGAFNLSEENEGKKIVVELRLYETDGSGKKTGNYVVCNKVEYVCY